MTCSDLFLSVPPGYVLPTFSVSICKAFTSDPTGMESPPPPPAREEGQGPGHVEPAFRSLLMLSLLPAGLVPPTAPSPRLPGSEAPLPCSHRQTRSSSPHRLTPTSLLSTFARWAMGGCRTTDAPRPRPSNCRQCLCVCAWVRSRLAGNSYFRGSHWAWGFGARVWQAVLLMGLSTLVLGVGSLRPGLSPSLRPRTCHRWMNF